MIHRLQVKNYRSLADIDITLEPLTVFVGHNGSGKSNLVDVLRFVQDALRLGLDAAIVNRHGMSVLRRWSDKGRAYNIEITLDIRTESVTGSYSFTLGSERRGEYRVKRETALLNQLAEKSTLSFETYNSKWRQKPKGIAPKLDNSTLILPLLAHTAPYKNFYEFIAGMSFYNIFPNSLAEPQKPANPYPLNEHGINLASALRDIQRNSKDKNTHKNLVQSIQRVMPDIVDFQVSQIGGYLLTKIRRAIVDQKRAMFELSQESDGTLRMLGILTALHQTPPRTLIALEEPELTIHPGVLHLLWDEIEDAAKASQVILTTHSPDLLDLCDADSLRVVEKIDGLTQVDKVDDIQRQAIKERLFTAGQLLRAQGLHRAEQLDFIE